jgi:ATP-dependent DNA helicase RecG
MANQDVDFGSPTSGQESIVPIMKKSPSTPKNLTYPVQFLKGIGPHRAEALAAQGVHTVRDLLYYFPYGYIDLTKTEKISNLRSVAESGQWITVIGTVRVCDIVGRPPRQRLIIILGDETGTVQLVFFQGIKFFKNAFEEGEQIAASGKVTRFNNKLQIVHPSVDRISGGDDEEIQGFLHTGGIVPKYGSSEAMKDVRLHVKGFRRIIRNVLDEFYDAIEEILPIPIIEKNKYSGLSEALRSIHFPESSSLLEEAQRRLKYDELFIMQLLLAIRRTHNLREASGISFNIQSVSARRLVDSLPFQLTKAQLRVINEIADDMRSGKPMNRLLHGDVGCGKTIVALLAMLIAIDNGYQVALMAPTEILAEQHYRTMTSLLNNIDVNIRFLIGGQKSKLRKDVLEDIRQGSAKIIIGTHALIQEQVIFANLGLVVIDEQHRFGVAQRAALRLKGGGERPGAVQPDILIMSATPIPRTLSLTIFGDLDVSTIDELPPNRKQVATHLRLESQMKNVYDFINREMNDGRQIYIVYPLIEESEKIDLKAATESYRHLQSVIFPDRKIGLLHGRMSADEKDEIMTAFKNGEINILVSTTVIEVGIDVPNASVMVIEHAERFGLSQLHQLRGRVGRGASQSHCILIAPNWYGTKMRRSSAMPSLDGSETEKMNSIRRIQTMLGTNDGFKIAEIDLELRGPGDFFGTRQSGLPLLRIANLLTDTPILLAARDEAFHLIADDPHLRRSENQPLKKYLDTFMRESFALLAGG